MKRKFPGKYVRKFGYTSREHARSRGGRTCFLSSAKFDSPNPEFHWALVLFALVFTVKLLALFQRP